MQNMQNNMQTPKTICRIVHCPYSAYLTYICTPHFGEVHRSNNNQGHIVLYTTLLIGHTQHRGHMRVSSWPMVPKKLQQTNRQDWVFIRPPI
jgi:hypothetical protein